MQTKIVYTLVSGIDDYYLEQALISVHSLRLYNPDANVVLVIDDRTERSLIGTRAAIKDYVSEVITVPFAEELDNMERSRFLKTTLRTIVDGDYLFVDCDTLVCGTLEDVDQLACDIGMVSDLNAPLPVVEQTVVDKCAKAGFSNVKGKPYFNSGIIYCKDTDISHDLYREWFRMWESSKTKGVPYDQPALCQANINQGYPIHEISGIWNCQYKFSTEYLRKAKILHYYFNGSDRYHLFQIYILEMVKRNGRIDSALNGILMHPRDRFYALFSITETSAISYFNTDMFYLYYDMPNIYKMSVKIIRVLKKILISIKG